MKSEPLMSIIVPVYKVEEYLSSCVDSILSQSFKDFELILVVNGLSPDRCPALCAEYAAQDSRVLAVNIKDVGVSLARNAGILSARGKYILFIDGDDFIAEGSLNNLFESLKKDGDSDVIFLCPAHYYPDGRMRRFNDCFEKEKLYNKSKKDALSFIASLSDFNTSVCLKLIRKEIISANNISFAENITFAEDSDFSLNLFLYAETFNYCGSYVYYYRKERQGSATYDYSEKKYKDLLSVISKWSKKAENDSECGAFSQEIYRILSFQYCLLLSCYDKIEKTFRKAVMDETSQYAWLLEYNRDSRVSAVKWFYRFFGLKLTCAALTFRERFLGL